MKEVINENTKNTNEKKNKIIQKRRYIVFYDDVKDNDKQIVWVSGKKYKIYAESKDAYFCTCEKNKLDRMNTGIDKNIKNMYYTY